MKHGDLNDAKFEYFKTNCNCTKKKIQIVIHQDLSMCSSTNEVTKYKRHGQRGLAGSECGVFVLFFSTVFAYC